MNPHDDYDPRERSEDEEDDDIVYIEEDNNCSAAGSLRWTTSTSSQVPGDDVEATQASTGTHPQLPPSRGGRKLLPVIVTRRERRMLRRKQMEMQRMVQHDDDDSYASDEDQQERPVDEDEPDEGEDIFASVQAYLDQQKATRVGKITQSSEKSESEKVENTGEGKSDADKDFSPKGRQKDARNLSRSVGMLDAQWLEKELVTAPERSQEGNGVRYSSSERRTALDDKQGMEEQPQTDCDVSPRRNKSDISTVDVPENSLEGTFENEHFSVDGVIQREHNVETSPQKSAQMDGISPPVNYVFSQQEESVSHRKIPSKYRVQVGYDESETKMETLRNEMMKHHQPKNKQKAGQGYLLGETVDIMDVCQESVLEAARKEHRRRHGHNAERKELRKDMVTSFPRPLMPSSVGASRDGRISAAVSVEKAKSIVGSRPSHWGRNGINICRPFATSQTMTASSENKQRLSRAAALSQATKRRVVRPKKRRRKEGAMRNNLDQTKDGSFSVHSDSKHDTIKTESQISQRRVRNSHSHVLNVNAGTKWEQDADVRGVDFVPAFLAVTEDKEEPNAGDGATATVCNKNDPLTSLSSQNTPGICLTPVKLNEGNIVNASFRPLIPRAPRSSSARKRKKAGPLMTQLRSIRGSIEEDCVRFQSGTYPFQEPSRRRMDVNDPRNRAERYIDVTIVSQPFPWMNGETLVTVLGYMHNMVQCKRKTPSCVRSSFENSNDLLLPLLPPAGGDDSLKNPEDVTGFAAATGGPKQSCFSWICFTFNTVHEHRIAPQTQLRIYNPITIPVSVMNTNPDKSIPMVLCTQLCELYKKEMPQLSDVPSLGLSHPADSFEPK